MADAQMGLTTVMMVLLFGTNLCLYILFQLMQRFPTGRVTYEQVQQDTDEDEDDKVVKGGGGQKAVIPVAAAKKLSEPFVGSVDCFTNLTHELFRTGCILALTYICEKHWYTDHLGKTYDRDLFVFVLLLFFGYAFLTTKKTEDASLLSPDQTLEWKGWMQFIFLLYHYFHAEEVYNSVRVMITCYVWMTGFGQFSSYYMKQDFGWLKVSHNLWRLNFAVLLLMWTHGNTYILYYICPMHTFYFLMVYVTMYLYSSLNHTKWGIRYKLAALGVLIFIIWDVNGGLFDLIFAWLGTDSVVGATNGSVWEYYFRTSLDHWSSYLGMIFALNYPMADQFLTKVRGWPLVGTSVVMAVLSVWWYLVFYSQEKMAYNLTHSYFAIIPLTAYIFFRNVSMRLRRYVSHSLVDLGKTTLETYLLQHHIWLTSNAKTLLNITPGYPWVNFFLASLLFVLCSKELYRITTSLRCVASSLTHSPSCPSSPPLCFFYFSLPSTHFSSSPHPLHSQRNDAPRRKVPRRQVRRPDQHCRHGRRAPHQPYRGDSAARFEGIPTRGRLGVRCSIPRLHLGHRPLRQGRRQQPVVSAVAAESDLRGPRRPRCRHGNAAGHQRPLLPRPACRLCPTAAQLPRAHLSRQVGGNQVPRRLERPWQGAQGLLRD